MKWITDTVKTRLHFLNYFIFYHLKVLVATEIKK